LAPSGLIARRSGFQWLRGDGDLCRPGEVVGFCYLGLLHNAPGIEAPFAEEWIDLQVAVAPRVGGRLRHGAAASQGGFLDQLDQFQYWTPEFALGAIEPEPGLGPPLPGAADEVELLVATGRRRADVAEARAGFLSGWHDRSRAWRLRDGEPFGALLGVGVCEQAGVLRGESNGFLEFFSLFRGSGQAALVPDNPLVPTSRALSEQLARRQADREAIAADMNDWFARGEPRPTPADWIFMGATLNALWRSVLTEPFDVFSRTELRRAKQSDALILSANGEAERLFRHKTLGYHVAVHAWRLARTGLSARAWLDARFEPVRRSIDDVAADYRRLFETVRADPALPQALLVFNSMSTDGEEDLQRYDFVEGPLSRTLRTSRSKEANLMLGDLAREFGLGVIDLDAIAADVGAQRNLPDGVHGSGLLQSELRVELLRMLGAMGVAGFATA